MVDLLLVIGIAILTLLISWLGVYVALHPPNDSPSKVKWVTFWFVAIGASICFLVVWQFTRQQESKTKSDEAQTKLLVKIGHLEGQIQSIATMVGPASLENQRRIIDGITGMSSQQKQTILTVAPERRANLPVSQKQRLLILAADIFGCVAERSAMTPSPGENPATVQEDYQKQKRWIEESTSYCMSRLGARIFASWAEAKNLGAELGDASFISRAMHDLHELASIAAEFEKAGRKAK